MMVTAALRVIDAAANFLQQVRNRIAPSGAEDSSEGSEGGKRTLDERTPAPAATRTRGLLFYSLVVLLCVALGGGTGMLIAYRGLSRVNDAREMQIERLKNEIAQSKMDATRAAKTESKLQVSIFELRKELREAREEAEDYKSQIEGMKKLPPTARTVERAERQATRAHQPVPAPSGPKAAPQAKSGTCSAGAGNSTEDLVNCIRQLNNR